MHREFWHDRRKGDTIPKLRQQLIFIYFLLAFSPDWFRKNKRLTTHICKRILCDGAWFSPRTPRVLLKTVIRCWSIKSFSVRRVQENLRNLKYEGSACRQVIYSKYRGKDVRCLSHESSLFLRALNSRTTVFFPERELCDAGKTERVQRLCSCRGYGISLFCH